MSFFLQFLISGALEMASGYIGALGYLEYAVPSLKPAMEAAPGGTRWVGVAAVVAVTLLLCQRIRNIGWLSIVMCAGTIITVLLVIICGLANFDSRLIEFPSNAFQLNSKFAFGLGGAMPVFPDAEPAPATSGAATPSAEIGRAHV